MCMSAWSSDVCSSDLGDRRLERRVGQHDEGIAASQFHDRFLEIAARAFGDRRARALASGNGDPDDARIVDEPGDLVVRGENIGEDSGWRACAFEELGKSERALRNRSEAHTSELQSLMRISYAVFCLT